MENSYDFYCFDRLIKDVEKKRAEDKKIFYSDIFNNIKFSSGTLNVINADSECFIMPDILINIALEGLTENFSRYVTFLTVETNPDEILKRFILAHAFSNRDDEQLSDLTTKKVRKTLEFCIFNFKEQRADVISYLPKDYDLDLVLLLFDSIRFIKDRIEGNELKIIPITKNYDIEKEVSRQLEKSILFLECLNLECLNNFQHYSDIKNLIDLTRRTNACVICSAINSITIPFNLIDNYIDIHTILQGYEKITYFHPEKIFTNEFKLKSEKTNLDSDQYVNYILEINRIFHHIENSSKEI